MYDVTMTKNIGDIKIANIQKNRTNLEISAKNSKYQNLTAILAYKIFEKMTYLTYTVSFKIIQTRNVSKCDF